MTTGEKYINPFTDFGFKRLFGTEFNKDLLIDFLNQVLAGKEQIRDLTYLNTEHQGKHKAGRKAIFDVYCENQKGDRFIIEVQNIIQGFFKDRSIFYATFPIQQQSEKGKGWDYELKSVYTVAILNFSFPDAGNRQRYLREIKLMDTDTLEVFYEKLTFIYLEMPRFKKSEAELETHFEKWLYILKNLQRLQNQPAKLQDRIFKKLFAQAEIAGLNPDDMKTYQESLKVYRDNKNTLDYAIQIAREEAKSQGKVEGQLEIAGKLKQKGLSVEMIVETTGLTREQIERL